MSQLNDSDVPVPSVDAGLRARTTRRRWKRIGISLAAIGGLLLAPQAFASATPAKAQGGMVIVPKSLTASSALAAPTTPPAGKAWIQGTLTDQAGHPLDNLNVEIWAAPTAAGRAPAGGPVASNLTYAGTGPGQAHGVFRVEVPSNAPYVVAFSVVNGVEDGDAYRGEAYGSARPIMARTSVGAAGLKAGTTLKVSGAAAPGRILDLGTTQLVHQGRVASTLKVKSPKKVTVGDKVNLKYTVKSKYVSAPTGKVQVKINGKKIKDRLTKLDKGTGSVKLPKLKKPGNYHVTVTYKGSSTVAKAKPDTAKFTVKKPKKGKGKK